MLAWQAKMDVQFVLNAYACIMHVYSLIYDELKSQLRKVGSAFLTHREVSAQGTVYRILSLPMKQLDLLYLLLTPKRRELLCWKSNASLTQLEDNDTKSLIDRYQHRPQQLSSMCLAEFAATYVVKYERNDWCWEWCYIHTNHTHW